MSDQGQQVLIVITVVFTVIIAFVVIAAWFDQKTKYEELKAKYIKMLVVKGRSPLAMTCVLDIICNAEIIRLKKKCNKNIQGIENLLADELALYNEYNYTKTTLAEMYAIQLTREKLDKL